MTFWCGLFNRDAKETKPPKIPSKEPIFQGHFITKILYAFSTNYHWKILQFCQFKALPCFHLSRNNFILSINPFFITWSDEWVRNDVEAELSYCLVTIIKRNSNKSPHISVWKSSFVTYLSHPKLLNRRTCHPTNNN